MLDIQKRVNSELDSTRSLKHYKMDDIKSKYNFTNISDLVEKSHMTSTNYDLLKVKKLTTPLLTLNNLVGMNNIKQQIIDQIMYFIQHTDDHEMNHTIITGSPGTGKTTLAKILANIYLNLGIFKNNKFIIAKRSDLIGRYLGETAIKTQKIIDMSFGGVLFIDEVYSLGNESSTSDIYSKECIDTINQNLSENAGKFICIIAGYKDQVEKCFLNKNSGLNRRFAWKYDLNEYTDSELKNIILKKIFKSSWKIHNLSFLKSWFKGKKEFFINQGGDIDLLFTKIKIAHSKRVFGLPHKYKKILIKDDFDKGLVLFIKNNYIKKDTVNYNLYI